MNQSIPRRAAQASALALILSVLPVWPYLYQTLLRYLVGVTAIFLVIRADELNKSSWVWLWIAVAIVFNPIVPLYLAPQTQAIMSLACGLVFVLSARILRL
jgi:uncharacterized membrane protein